MSGDVTSHSVQVVTVSPADPVVTMHAVQVAISTAEYTAPATKKRRVGRIRYA